MKSYFKPWLAHCKKKKKSLQFAMFVVVVVVEGKPKTGGTGHGGGREKSDM